MSKPPKTTIIFKNVPNDTQNWLIGIDTKFFTINQVFQGIKLVPDGIHLIHYSIPSHSKGTAEDIQALSIRYGKWIDCYNDVVVFYWDTNLEKFEIFNGKNEPEALNYAKFTADLGEIYHRTIAYPENEVTWNGLTLCLNEVYVDSIIHTNELSTISSSKEENLVLLQQLQTQESPDEMNYTILNFKAKRPGSSLEQISKDYLDKSWYLEQTYQDENMFAELQLSFLNFVILGNFCSGLQWLNILKLLLMSKLYIENNKSFSLGFLQIFKLQLETIPEEYVGETISLNSAVDTKSFIDIMENFVKDIYPQQVWNGNCCGKMKLNGMILELWKQIVHIINYKFKMNLNKLENPDISDGFEVFDLNDYDENDEDLPTIVNL